VRPLEGRRIVLTRAAHQSEELAHPLRELGAEVILLPTIGIAAPADPEPLRRSAARCDEYDWIIFTSVNAVTAFRAELSELPGKAQIAAVGEATRDAAEERGFTVMLTPEKYVSEALVEAFGEHKLNGHRILIPSAAVTREVVAAELRKLGAEVEVVEAYRNVLPPEAVEQAPTVFREPFPDWVVFASPSAVDNLVHIVGREPLGRLNIASIGPVTSEAVRKHGLKVAAEASIHSVRGLVRAICGEASSIM
jgi:uroporphyrinogen-III synthase